MEVNDHESFGDFMNRVRRTYTWCRSQKWCRVRNGLEVCSFEFESVLVGNVLDRKSIT